MNSNHYCNRANSDWLVRVLIAPLLLVSACSVGPDYNRPPVTTPARYKEADPASMAQSIDDVIKTKWWEMFGDTELNALEEQVDLSNQTVAQAEARFRQARALVVSARAAYYPTVTLGVGVTRQQNSPTESPGPAESGATVYRTHACRSMSLGKSMSGAGFADRWNPTKPTRKPMPQI